jgi:hypothetical protein
MLSLCFVRASVWGEQEEVDVKLELVESLRLGMEALKLFFNLDEEPDAAPQEEKLEVRWSELI